MKKRKPFFHFITVAKTNEYDTLVWKYHNIDYYQQSDFCEAKEQLALLQDILRNCKGHMFATDMFQCSFAPAGVVSRCRAYARPKQSIKAINFYVPLCKWILYFVNLGIRLVLFMLLVQAGDVERNPGPPKSRMPQGEGKKLMSFKHVDITTYV